MSSSLVIARMLEQRGFDFEIALVFADDARERGRMNGNVSIAEAVEIVAAMMTPRGVFADTTRMPSRPRSQHSHAVRSTGRRPSDAHPLDAYGTWLIT